MGSNFTKFGSMGIWITIGGTTTPEENGDTLLSGPVPDQPLPRKVRDPGLPLTAIRQLKDASNQQILKTQRIELMNANLKLDKKVPQNALEDTKLNVKLKLAALWQVLCFYISMLIISPYICRAR